VGQSVYTVIATAPATITAGQSASSTVTVNTSTGYTGAVTLSCSLTGSPANALTLPTCEVLAPQLNLQSGITNANGQIVLATTARTSAMARPGKFGFGATGGASLALLVLFGISKRRRALWSMLGVVGIVLLLAGISACGGGSSGSSGGGGTTTGTTAGSYTFTITATGDPAVSPAPTATVTLVVQ
jgi:hypothetical protein